MQSRKRKEAFTLIELLIVVAIIAILAAIAVPNFLEAQVRSKVATALADMRALANAMEAYRVDWDTYPPWNSWDNQLGGATGRRNMNPGRLWWVLTTPIPYLSAALVDPFVAIGRHSEGGHAAGDADLLDAFLQTTTGYIGSGSRTPGDTRTEWLSMSYGPDGADDTGLNSAYPYTQSALPYDPTNGTVSWCDIYRHAGRVPVNFIAGSSAVPQHGSACNNNQGNGDPYSWTH
jgi:prepilin-type N-terminal cleavage/methylation domain-containing protein